MAYTLRVHDYAGAQLATVAPKRGSSSWRHKVGEDGSGKFTGLGSVAATALAEGRIVRIHNGTRDVFAFVPDDKARRALDSPGQTEVDLSGPGVRHLLHAAQILPEDTSDCAGPADTRWFGWMSGAYDDAGWAAPASFGTFLSGPWVTARPENWPAPLAEYIGISLDPLAGDTDWGARATVTLAAEADYIACIGADDEYRLWIDGREVLSTIGGGPFQWQRWQQQPLKLCAGTHTIAIQVRNLARPAGLEATNYSWLQFALAPAGDDGKPRSANQEYALYHDHTGGTFTLSSTFSETGAAIAWNAAASTVQSTLEAMATVGAGNVTVTGSGTPATPWEITFGGDLASKHIPLTANGAALTGGTAIEVDEWERGRGASAVLRSDTANWVVRDFTAAVPGLTATHMLRIVDSEARARGETVFDHITEDFTDTLSTSGEAMPEIVLPVSLPADVHRLAVMLEQAGHQIELAPDLALRCWRARGVDRSSGVGAVDLTAWTAGVRGLEATVAEGVVSNVLRVRTDEGWHEVTDAASITARGRWEDGTELEFSSEAEADLVTGPMVARDATPPRRTTLELSSTAAAAPYDDFDLCDLVLSSAWATGGFDDIAMRWVGVTAQIEDSAVVYRMELID